MADSLTRPDGAASVPGGVTAADSITTRPTPGAGAPGDAGSQTPAPGLADAGQGQHAAITDLDTDKADTDGAPTGGLAAGINGA